MNQALVQVRVDTDLKEQTMSIYNAIGLDLPTAIRMFLKKTVMVGGLPFDGRLYNQNNAAQSAFATMRAKVEAAQGDEPTMDDINDFISSVRKTRKQNCVADGNIP